MFGQSLVIGKSAQWLTKQFVLVTGGSSKEANQISAAVGLTIGGIAAVATGDIVGAKIALASQMGGTTGDAVKRPTT